MNWNAKVREAFARAARVPDDDVIEELAQHARAMYEAARADGGSPDEAERRVMVQVRLWCDEAPALRRARANAAPAIDPPRAGGASWFAGIGQDVRYSLRLLRRQARYAVLVILTMALSIGATTTLFSVTYGVLMRPLPWPAADRLVVLKETRGGRAPRFGDVTNAAYVAWRDDAKTIDGIAAWSLRTSTLTGAGDPERLRLVAATASLFPVLEAKPLLGTVFQEKDEALTAASGGSVIVLSERLWRQRFAADPSIVGHAITLDGTPYTIVGVLPDALAFPDRQTLAWIPFRVPPATGNLLSLFSAVAKLRDGVSVAQAAAEGTGRGRFAPDTGMTTTAIFGGKGAIEIAASPMLDTLTKDVRGPLLVLLAAVLLLLVTATANVASLQLTRATTRRREIAIRAALGAGGARVTRQLAIESLVLALAGGIAGLALSAVLHRSLPTLLPADFPRADALGVNGAVVAFALLVSVAAGLIFGVVPALRVRRLNLVDSLSQDGVGGVAGARSHTARARLAIMAAQVAIACVLLVGASLLLRSFAAMVSADRGYDPAGIMTARVSLPSPAFTPERRFAIAQTMLDRLDRTPAVTAAGFTSEMPLTAGGSTSAFSIPSRSADGGTMSIQASPRIVSPRAFAALGMRIVAGRGFTDQDTETSMPVVVVNRALARRYFGDQAVGVTVPIAYARKDGRTPDGTIVGVVDDIRYVANADSTQPEMYYSYRQMEGRLVIPVVTLLVRTDGDPRALAPALRAAVAAADQRLVADGMATMEERVLRLLARPRLYGVVLGGFAGFALLIAGVGLFGVLSYSVAQRSRELAVRAALGATRGEIGRLVLRQVFAVVGSGLIAGLIASAWLTGLLSAQLYGVSRHDGVTFVAVPIVLMAIALVACAVPVRRAATMDPLQVLRQS
jgi:putative ABC transport system permease protein